MLTSRSVYANRICKTTTKNGKYHISAMAAVVHNSM
ncbi:hypothetical protein T10_2858 [Trichinella papuae]|uniref:Uncharacterized protein n=1 Tax=Trichinella papuae TaxID=268474 RepID=A0A0V1M123_9BILA|nr:hypothetical protein T10_2858 [Trichinella papuae]